MKKLIFLLLMIFFCSSVASAQSKWNDSIKSSTDLAMYVIARTDINETKPVAWVTHESGKLFYEIRANFDAKETGGILAGKTFALKNKSFWITPKVGILFGLNKQGYDGVSVEANLGGKSWFISYFMMNQLAIPFGAKPAFFYNFSSIGFQYWRIKLAYSFQLYHELKNPYFFIDQGPQITLFLGRNFYLKPWYTWDPGRPKLQKFACGFGYYF